MAFSKFLDPKNDFCFKQIFGTEKNKDILIHFLNDILNQGEQKITEVTFLPTIQDPEIAAYRKSIIDVLCKDQNGEQVIVEMQVDWHDGFEKRAQYYAAKAYSRQVIKEDEKRKKLAVYAKVNGVIFLAIADFIMFPEKNTWKSEHRVLDTKTYENDLKDFYFVFLELGKFKKPIEQLKNLEEKWMYFFKHAEESTFKDIEHLIGNDVIIRRAFEAVDQASWSEAELNTYEERTKAYYDNLAVEQGRIKLAEDAAEAKGIAKGIAKGEATGIEKVAINMLKQGADINFVSTVTGYTIEQVTKIKNQL